MTYALSLILWIATAQTAGQPATVVVQWPPTDTERVLRAQLDEARGELKAARREVANAKERLAKLMVDVRLDERIVSLALLRDGKWEMETEVPTSFFQVAWAMPGGAQ